MVEGRTSYSKVHWVKGVQQLSVIVIVREPPLVALEVQ